MDLDVRPGERRAILGPNGAGKTTLFNLISGEFPPTAGTVELFGGDVTALPARKRARMGLSRTFQTSRLFGGLTVDDNLYLAVLGVHDGHFRLDADRARGQRDARARPRDGRGRRARATSSTSSSPSSRTASSASSRSAWRAPPTRS